LNPPYGVGARLDRISDAKQRLLALGGRGGSPAFEALAALSYARSTSA